MDPLQTTALLRPVLTELAAVTADVTPDRLGDPTPCHAFDVRALTEHVTAWLGTFAGAYAAPDGRATATPVAGETEPAAAAQAVRSAAARLDAAVQEGAGERPVHLGDDAMPGDLALSMMLGEYVVHGWDLARATGQPWQPDEAAVAAALAFLPGMLTEDHQGEGRSFGPRVPVAADAPGLHRLLGLVGRDPAWSPGTP